MPPDTPRSTSTRRPAAAPRRQAAGPDAATIHHGIRRDHSEETAQDYVEAIAALIQQSNEARAVDLARKLGVSHVTVVRRVARLVEQGYVTSEPYRAIFLTDKGRALAEECTVRHETVLAFLLAVGVPAAAAERDAEGIEHHVSPETLEAMNGFLKRNS
ncbi:MAG: mntR [Verrucomicrobiales bacterium]|nr:mntR [Verrucomicrobiales bacterium]